MLFTGICFTYVSKLSQSNRLEIKNSHSKKITDIITTFISKITCGISRDEGQCESAK